MWNENLSGQALNIAATNASPLRVLAGPGTGKTYALKRRVARLIEEGAQPEQILVCTFTRTAAQDLKNEVASLNVKGAEDVEARTLHSLCFKILMKEDVYALIGRVCRPLLAFEQRFLLEDLRAKGFGTVKQCERKIEAFNAAWATKQMDSPGLPIKDEDRACHNYLLDWLIFHKAMLIGELIPLTLDYLKLNPAANPHNMFSHIMVDEYQDLNKSEQSLIDVLSDGRPLTIIGDEDQSIYSFRYAHPEGISEFSVSHGGTADESLDTCRRCDKAIVNVADSLISHNTRQHSRSLLADASKADGEIYYVQWPDLADELSGIVEFVASRIQNGLVRAGDVLILAQKRKIGYEIRNRLNSIGITCRSYFREEQLEGDPKKDTSVLQERFTLLTLAADPDDRVALRCWCGFGSNNLNVSGWQRIRLHCEQNGLSPRETLELLITGQVQIPHTQIIQGRFRLLKEKLAGLEGLKGLDLANALFPTSDPQFITLNEMAKSTCLINEDSAAKDILADLRERISQPETPSDVSFVRVMSIHKSKGLSADLVVIAGCVEGVIPQIDSDATVQQQAQKMEEQRRLFYVGLTRAKHTLVLSNCLSFPAGLAYSMGMAPLSNRQGQFRTTASRFLRELGSSSPTPMAGARFRQVNRTIVSLNTKKMIADVNMPVIKVAVKD